MHNLIQSFAIKGRAPSANVADVPLADSRSVSAAYFHTLGMRLLDGRAFYILARCATRVDARLALRYE